MRSPLSAVSFFCLLPFYLCLPRYGLIETTVPGGTASKSSLTASFSRATQPHVQSDAVPPPCMKISPPSDVSHGGHCLPATALKLRLYCARVISPSRKPRAASSSFG